MIAVPYHRRQSIAPGVDLTFLDAGHVLGSAIVVLDVDDDGQRKRLVFTGDLGRRHMPILRDPEIPAEATRADHGEHVRRSPARADRADGRRARGGARAHVPARRQGRDPVVRARARAGGDLALKRLRHAGRIPAMPVYVDSPLTVKITAGLPAAPRVLRRGGAQAAAERRLAVRVRGPALRAGRRGVEGDRCTRRAVRDHLGQRHVRGGPRAPPPEGHDRGSEERGGHRRLSGPAHARAAHRRAPAAHPHLRRRAQACRPRSRS